MSYRVSIYPEAKEPKFVEVFHKPTKVDESAYESLEEVMQKCMRGETPRSAMHNVYFDVPDDVSTEDVLRSPVLADTSDPVERAMNAQVLSDYVSAHKPVVTAPVAVSAPSTASPVAPVAPVEASHS
nr:MAG: hypothetical protein [Microvirus sp.]